MIPLFPMPSPQENCFFFFWVQGCPPYGHIVVQGLNLAPLPNRRVIAQLTLQHPATKKYDLTHVRLLFCGAAPLSAALIEAITRILPRAVIGQGYGSFPRL
jgi:hypothetical protein